MCVGEKFAWKGSVRDFTASLRLAKKSSKVVFNQAYSYYANELDCRLFLLKSLVFYCLCTRERTHAATSYAARIKPRPYGNSFKLFFIVFYKGNIFNKVPKNNTTVAVDSVVRYV